MIYRHYYILTFYGLFVIINTSNEREVIKMTTRKILDTLIRAGMATVEKGKYVTEIHVLNDWGKYADMVDIFGTRMRYKMVKEDWGHLVSKVGNRILDIYFESPNEWYGYEDYENDDDDDE
jgi:hypothetical protein